MQPRRSSTMGPIHVTVRKQSDATAQASYSPIHATVRLKILLCLIHACDVTVRQQSDATAQALCVTDRFMSRFGNRVSHRSSTMGYIPIHATVRLKRLLCLIHACVDVSNVGNKVRGWFMSWFGNRVSHRSSSMGYSPIHSTVRLKRLLCLIHACADVSNVVNKIRGITIDIRASLWAHHASTAPLRFIKKFGPFLNWCVILLQGSC